MSALTGTCDMCGGRDNKHFIGCPVHIQNTYKKIPMPPISPAPQAMAEIAKAQSDALHGIGMCHLHNGQTEHIPPRVFMKRPEPQAMTQGDLTDEQIIDMSDEYTIVANFIDDSLNRKKIISFARALLAAHPVQPTANYFKQYIEASLKVERLQIALAKTTQAQPEQVVVSDADSALQLFTEWFVKNYPGPDTIIFDPKWHAPRVYRALTQLLSVATAQEAKQFDVRTVLLEVVPDADGMGQEVYAKNVDDVVRVLTEMSERIEAFELASAQPAPTQPLCRDDGRCQYAIDVCMEGISHCPAGKCCMPSDSEEDAYVIDRLSKLLAGVCIALKGDEEKLHRHSYHDIVEVAEKIKLELDLYRADAATPQQSVPALPQASGDLPELPEMSYFLENSTHAMQRDAIRCYAKEYARKAIAQTAPAVAGEAIRDAVNEALENAAKLIDADVEEAIAEDCENGIIGALVVSADTVRNLKTAAPSQGAKHYG